MKTLAENPGESSAGVDAAEVDASIAAQMRRLARSFLVHSFLARSFLYERLGEPLIELRDAHLLPDTLPRPVRSGCRACRIRPGEVQG